jgi:putative transposase
MRQGHDSGIAELMEQLIANGSEGMGSVFAGLFSLAMQVERERFLGADSYERSETRRGYANGFREKKLDTLAGTISVEVPKTRGTDEPFYPQSLERGRRSTRAVLLAVAEMYIQGVSTRDVEKVMAEFGIERMTSTQVSRAVQMLDGELEAWRNRSLGQTPYVVLDARYEKVRVDGVVQDVAVLSAVGVDLSGARRVLGVSVAKSEAEVHWRAFLESLVERGLRGVRFVVSDNHAGLAKARRAVLGGATWQRCQFHLAQNAIHHCPTLAVRKRIGRELRAVWNASSLEFAQEQLKLLVETYRKSAPKLAKWLEENITEGLAVFSQPEAHRRRMRTSNGIERAVQQEIKRRTRKVRIFPNEASLLRLVSAVLVEIDESWAAKKTPYINWKSQAE